MPKRRQKELKPIKVGSVSIPRYQLGDGRIMIAFPTATKRRQCKIFTNPKKALEEGERIARELQNSGHEAQIFTTEDRADFSQAKKDVSQFGFRVHVATAQWARALSLIGNRRFSLEQVVEAGLVALSRTPHSIPDIVSELLQSKAPQDLHGRYARGLKISLEKFAERFPCDIREVKAKHIEEYLATFNVGSRRRDNILDEIRHLFQFARLRGYTADTISEARKVSTIHKRGREISYFSPVEMRFILDNVLDEWLPFVVLACFAGIRSEELARGKDASRGKDPLRWEDFDWTEREIHLRPETSKIGRKRIIPILDNAFEWLRPWHSASGPVAPATRPDREFGKNGRLERTINRILSAAPALQNDRPVQLHLAAIAPEPIPLLTEFHWRPNAMRHSYGSYRASMIKNIHQLADEMGNSVEMVHRHYRNPRPASQARAYFGLYPKSKAANVTPIRGAA